jgi:autotransporter translocation and assembly factor TamB
VGDEEKNATPRRSLGWKRKLVIAGAIVFVLFVLFHGPILRPLARNIALRLAARENLKLDFQIEGSVLGGVVLRNIHATATGPSGVESVDADFARFDYSLWPLIFRGGPDLQTVELRSASIVLDPSKAKLPELAKPNKKRKLRAIFPEQVHLAGVNLTVRDHPQDLVLQNLNLDLDPRQDGDLRIDRLQIPNWHTWTNVTATTSYTNRNLFLRDLVVDERNKFATVNIDASRFRSKLLGFTVTGSTVGGTVQGVVTLQEKKSSLATEINVSVDKISLGKLAEYFGHPSDFIGGEVENLKIDWRGVLKKPKTWNGSIIARLTNVRQKDLALDAIDLNLATAGGVATVKKALVTAGANRVQLDGTATLPESADDFGQTPADLKLLVHAPNLKQLTGFLSPPITGVAEGTGDVRIKNQTILLRLSVTGNEIGFGEVAAKQLTATVNASKKVSSKLKEPYYSNLVSTIRVEANDVHHAQYIADSAHAEIDIRNKEVFVRSATLVRNTNELSLQGKYELPPTAAELFRQAGDFDVTLSVPQLADFWESDSPDKIAGILQGDGHLRFKEGTGTGHLKVYGEHIAAKNLLVRQISAQTSMNGNTVYLDDLTATLSDKDSVKATGTFSLQKPHRYSGKLDADIADLSVLEPVLRAVQNQNELAGALKVSWEGSGEAAEFRNSGVLKLSLDKGRYGDLRSLQANIDANYSPKGLNVPIIFLSSDRAQFQAVAQTTGETLEIFKVQIDQGQAKYASGYFSVPFVWKNLGSERALFPASGKVNATFQSENLDLKKLFEDFGMRAPVSGTTNVKLDAQGTLQDLRAQIDMHMRDLRSHTIPNLEPATFDIAAHIENRQLLVNGKLLQTKIQPIEVQANMPFDAVRIVEEGKINGATPISARVRLPRSSINFVRQFVPDLEEVDGDLAMDVNVNGTVANPVLSGAGDMTINVVRFTNATIPAIRGLKTRFDFNRDTLSLSQVNGELAGGPFSISGRVTFPKLTEPNIDLQLKANSILVARNDSLTARTDADVRVTGPLASATVTGNVALTNSQFLKNIDLIPIGLPGRPAPRPPESRPEFSFPDPPLRDWKFDVAIKTKDPFLIRGNLATGGAITDVRLTGTGLRPALSGVVRLENVEATLPFSRLEIASGFLYFNPDDSFNPRIDLHGTSVVRDYTIHVYVYGTSLSPEALFTSEPPLPQEEIISLLATGTTRQELTGSNNVLAGRAAMLLVQQLYRKVFKKGASPQSNSVFDRLDVDFGQVDPKTGQQTATARFKINQNFVLVGDLGVGGDFRGVLKYVIRFR